MSGVLFTLAKRPLGADISLIQGCPERLGLAELITDSAQDSVYKDKTG